MKLLATEDDIRFAYRLLLGRKPDKDGMAHFVKLVHDNAMSTIDLATSFIESPEFRSAHPEMFPPTNDASMPPVSTHALACSPCTMSAIESATFRFWSRQLNDLPGRSHRKLWEWCFIAQSLYERKMLREGSRGLGFAVGQEPLTALFSSRGCQIVATDIDHESAEKDGWISGNQHASGLEHLNRRQICPPELLARNVSFQIADMRSIPEDFRTFDFLWSSCAMEHLGSLENGIEFVFKSGDKLWI